MPPVPSSRFSRVVTAVTVVLLGCLIAGSCADPADPPTAGRTEPTRVTSSYGDGPEQFGVLHLPARAGDGLTPTVVLVHGGFWFSSFTLDLMDPLADDLVARGYAVWNLEFRRTGSGGGWPVTGEDVVAGIEHLGELADPHRLDLDAVAVVGHSSGGQLAMWAAERTAAATDVVPVLAVGLAPVVNLVKAAQDGAGGGRAVQTFLGGEPEEAPDRYRDATPPRDPAVALLIVRGEDDAIVPRAWSVVGPAHRAALVEVAATDHFDVIDPEQPAWAAVVLELDAALGR